MSTKLNFILIPIRILGILLRVIRIPFRKQENNRVLVMPPSGQGSLGDEAMVQSLIQTVEVESENESMGIIKYVPTDCYKIGTQDLANVDLSGFINGNLLSSAVNLFRASLTYHTVVAIGADVLDGYYNQGNSIKRLLLLEFFSRCGLKVRIVSFSLNKKISQQITALFIALSDRIRMFPRDPISFTRLARIGRPALTQAADLAFLLQPAHLKGSLADIADWADRQRANGRIIMAVNANYLGLKKKIFTKDKLIAAYLSILTEVAFKKSTSFLLIPHDFRDRPNDQDLLHELLNKLEDFKDIKAKLVRGPYSAAEAKALVGKADVLITGRMHLAIAALAQCIPVYCLTYQDKFEGLLELFSLEWKGRPMESLHHETDIVVADVLRIIESEDTFREKICAGLPQALNLSRRNVEGM